MESAGARLKKIRLEKGLTLEEVHKKTRINLNILKAIEEDSLINFSPVYIRGFLKIYCKFLRVNPTDFIADYKEPETAVQCTLKAEEKPFSIFKGILKKTLPFRQYITVKKILIVVLLVVSTAVLFNLGKHLATRGYRLAKKIKPLKVVADKTEKKKIPIAQARVGTAAKEENSQKSSVSGVRLGIRAKEDCLVELKSDGKILFKSILKKGRTEFWQAKEKIELILGNAGGVVLEVNNKFIPPVGRKGQSAKIIITKEGLEIGR